MAKILKGVLPKDEIKKITTGLFSAQFSDGGMSGGQLGNKLKNNTQVSPSSPQYRELSELDLRIKFQSSTAPLILQDLFQKICSEHFRKMTD